MPQLPYVPDFVKRIVVSPSLKRGLYIASTPFAVVYFPQNQIGVDIVKKLLTFSSILIFCILLSLGCLLAYAHSGDTDDNGGHWNHETGEYHYHHGQPAHQHTDGFCEYDYATPAPTDNNRSSIDTSGSKKSTTVATPTPSIDERASVESITITPRSMHSHFWSYLPRIIYSLIEMWFFIWIFISAIIGKPFSLRKRQAEKPLSRRKIRKQLKFMYAGASLGKLLDMPSGTFINEDGIPISYGPGRYGSKYTVFASEDYLFHSRKECGTNVVETHALYVNHRTPCSLCNPQLPDLEWYNLGIKLIKECKEYGIKVDW